MNVKLWIVNFESEHVNIEIVSSEFSVMDIEHLNIELWIMNI